MTQWKNLYLGCLVIFLCAGFFNWTRSAGASDLSVNIQVPSSLTGIQINDGSGQNNGDCLSGNGILKKAQRALKDFNKIMVNGIFTLSIRQQHDFVVEISCDANLYQQIQTKRVNDRLEINTDRRICPKRPVDIRIGLPELIELKALGSDDIIVSDLNNDQFLVTVDGSSDLRITGRTRTFSADLNGAGDLDASEFRAEKVLVTSRGAGDAIVHADREINAVLNGVGDVTCLGSPDRVIQRGDGVGDLIAE